MRPGITKTGPAIPEKKMESWRKTALAVVVALMVLGILLTWGSLFSVVMAFGLFSAAAVLMIRRFAPYDRESDFYGDQNG